MTISIDWTGADPNPPYQAAITIPQAYLTLITGTLYELDTDAFWDNLKAREDDEDGIVYGDLQIRFSSYTVAGVTFAPALLMQATVQFEDTGSQYSVRLAGTNNDIFDVENGILIPTDKVTVIAQNAAGLIESGVSGLTPSESAALLNLEIDVALLLAGQDLTNEQKEAEHITSKVTGQIILRNPVVMRRWEADAWEDEAKTIPYGTNPNAGIEAAGLLVEVAWS